MGGRSICPPGRKVVAYNTEGRFQLDKPAPATVGRPRVLGWGTARKAGASGEPGTAGESPRGSPRLSWLGPWWDGVVGEGAPPPRLARLLGLRQLVVGVCWCPYCVRLCMICSSVPQSPSLAPPNYPPTVYLYRGTGCLVLCAMARGKLSVFAHSAVPVSWRCAAGGADNAETGGGTSWVMCRAPGSRERGRLPLAAITFFFPVCLSLFFSLCAKRFLTSHSFAKPSRLYG